ncbi:hypothetical protein HAX54_051287, partial [Datura stramonium]|nr:hypothetical protein [Datura stramonium]
NLLPDRNLFPSSLYVLSEVGGGEICPNLILDDGKLDSWYALYVAAFVKFWWISHGLLRS